ncbi:MAG: SDR family oxidoreductase [Chloroflexi bacterium]|nr:SDR family oxidoreductase [Chloroflexota bacterium]MCI0836827.1 SDR family oxidoreductase [Chloroflexota bacterium]MCI0851922.1 SDR family oxidoreductase [Chloroflexota bacterium]
MSESPFDLSGRAALVTGGSRNMGRAYVLSLAQAGANVAILDLPVQEEAARSVGEEVASLGRESRFVPVDIRDVEALPEVVATAVRELGELHILVNNAGKTDDVSTPVIDYQAGPFDEHYEVMVRGTFFVSQAVARHMIDCGTRGSIINIASRVGEQVQPNNPGYSICKAAVIHMTRVMALELGGHGIRVNAIGPGPVPRPDTLDQSGQPTSGPAGERFLLGRRLQYDDLTGTALYLASDASEMVTGQFIIADGGLGLKSVY